MFGSYVSNTSYIPWCGWSDCVVVALHRDTLVDDVNAFTFTLLAGEAGQWREY